MRLFWVCILAVALGGLPAVGADGNGNNSSPTGGTSNTVIVEASAPSPRTPEVASTPATASAVEAEIEELRGLIQFQAQQLDDQQQRIQALEGQLKTSVPVGRSTLSANGPSATIAATLSPGTAVA